MKSILTDPIDLCMSGWLKYSLTPSSPMSDNASLPPTLLLGSVSSEAWGPTLLVTINAKKRRQLIPQSFSCPLSLTLLPHWAMASFIYLPSFFCLFTSRAHSHCPEIWFRLKACGSPVVSRKPRSEQRWFGMGNSYQTFRPHLISGPHGFCSASLQSPTDFQQFSSRERDDSCYKADAYICFLLLHMWRSPYCSSGQEGGKWFLFFIAINVGGLCEWN